MSKSLGNVIDPRTVIAGGKVRTPLPSIRMQGGAAASTRQGPVARLCAPPGRAASLPPSLHTTAHFAPASLPLPNPSQPPCHPSTQIKKDAKKDPPYGADVLRLWVASVDYSSDVLIGGRIISQVGAAAHGCPGGSSCAGEGCAWDLGAVVGVASWCTWRPVLAHLKWAHLKWAAGRRLWLPQSCPQLPLAAPAPLPSPVLPPPRWRTCTARCASRCATCWATWPTLTRRVSGARLQRRAAGALRCAVWPVRLPPARQAVRSGQAASRPALQHSFVLFPLPPIPHSAARCPSRPLPAAHAVPHAQLAAADRYILSRFVGLVEECTAAYESYQFYKWAPVLPCLRPGCALLLCLWLA